MVFELFTGHELYVALVGVVFCAIWVVKRRNRMDRERQEHAAKRAAKRAARRAQELAVIALCNAIDEASRKVCVGLQRFDASMEELERITQELNNSGECLVCNEHVRFCVCPESR